MTEINYPENSTLKFLKARTIHNILLLFLVSFSLQAQQIVVKSGKGYPYHQYDNNRIDWLVMMYEITNTSEIMIVLPEDSLSVSWYRYPDNQFMSSENTLSPDDHTGYIARINGTVDGKMYSKDLSVWVIDYKLYRPVFNALLPVDAQKGMCDQLTLTIDGQIPEMSYTTPSNSRFIIDRNFQLEYESLAWNDSWNTIEIKVPVEIQGNLVTISDPPYKDTYFKLTGDQFAGDLGVEKDSVLSSYYNAIRVIAKITTEATIRTEKNEGDRPESITTISGSAPLEINFSANGNVPVASYYYWEMYSGNEAFITRTDENHRYTFTEAGTFLVKLRVENAYCNYTDSVTIKVSESAISAPNVFTPNGDGINDEFRVAYKSIIEFDCWVFNRWGSKVYHWTDPQKGWDGTVNGKQAHEGAYFYVVKALGSDGIKYNLKGDINLLRGKQ
jgi:gliding motility-associated-like protein